MCCARLAGNAGPKKSRKSAIWAPSCRTISLQLRHTSKIRIKLVKQQYLPTRPHNMVNFGPLAADIVSLVCGTTANFNGFRVLAALVHGTLVVGISQTLRRWAEGAAYIRQGDYHVGHWPTFYFLLWTPRLTFHSESSTWYSVCAQQFLSIY